MDISSGGHTLWMETKRGSGKLAMWICATALMSMGTMVIRPPCSTHIWWDAGALEVVLTTLVLSVQRNLGYVLRKKNKNKIKKKNNKSKTKSKIKTRSKAMFWKTKV